MYSYSQLQTRRASGQKHHSSLAIALLLVSQSLLWIPRATAQVLSPGIVIENQATGSFIDSGDTTNTVQAIESNIVSVTVAEVAGITVTAANVPSNLVSSDIVNFDFIITNVGNDPTQFFIPSAPSSMTGGTAGSIQIMAYDADGASGATASVNLTASNITVPSGGRATGGTGGLLTSLATANNGSIPPNGTITVRVPVTIIGASGTTLRVTLGNTPVPPNPNSQNQPFVANTNDLYTVDNADGVAGETAGTPMNGDTTNRRQEASATQSASITFSGFDFGDAPTSLTAVDAALTSTYASARHSIDGLTYLGDRVDAETANQPTINADGDDNNGSPRDEDGVTFPLAGTTRVLSSGASNTLTVKASASGTLNAWIDWNQDGDWADSGEQIATDVNLSAGNNTLTVAVPNTAPHGVTYARFRFSTTSGLTPTGNTSGNGEVEDYTVNIALPAPIACNTGILNNGFEQPTIPTSGSGTPAILQDFGSNRIVNYRENDVPWWATRPNDPASGSGFDNRNAIELWLRGNSISPTPFEGNQFAELNANVPGQLYQDLAVPPGTQIRWQVAHRGRSGTDTFGVFIGIPGSEVSQGSYSTPNTAWRVYSGLYTVPANQYITRFGLRAISTAGGSISVGNFVDDVRLSNFCAPTVQGFKSVRLTTDADGNNRISPGDMLTYTVFYANNTSVTTGPAANFQMNDPLPSGLTITATGAQTIVAVSGGTTSANKNPNYTGASAGSVSDLLSPGALLDVGGRIRVDIPVTVNANASGVILNQATSSANEFSGQNVSTDNVDTTTTGLPSGVTIPTDSVAQQQNPSLDPTSVTIINPSVSSPGVLLVKRITGINNSGVSLGGDHLTSYIQSESNPYDDNVIEPTLAPNLPNFPVSDTDKWPNTMAKTSSTFLIGGINGGNTKPGDEVEYTIYFLSTGNTTANNVQMCDRIPNNQTFSPQGYNNVSAASGGNGSDRGIAVSYNGTDASYTNTTDGDTAQYYERGVVPLPAVCGGNLNSNPTGAIVVNLGQGATSSAGGSLPNATTTPNTNPTTYGFVRFKAKVD